MFSVADRPKRTLEEYSDSQTNCMDASQHLAFGYPVGQDKSGPIPIRLRKEPSGCSGPALKEIRDPFLEASTVMTTVAVAFAAAFAVAFAVASIIAAGYSGARGCQALPKSRVGLCLLGNGSR